MPAVLVLQKRDSFSLDGFSQDDRGLICSRGFSESIEYLTDVVTIYPDCVPTKGLKLPFVGLDIMSMHRFLRLTQSVYIHDSTEVIESEYYLQTHSTNPLLQPDTITAAINTFFKNISQHDSLFGVTRLQTRLWDQEGHPVNHDPSILLRTQDLPPIFEENSCIYLFSKEMLLERGNRLGEHPMMFEISPNEALDIDEELDFILAETIFRQLNS